MLLYALKSEGCSTSGLALALGAAAATCSTLWKMLPKPPSLYGM